MSVTQHKRWQIESRSYQADVTRWYPRALVTLFDGRAGSTHDVRALLSVTFDSARDADDYAVKMAKTWIEDKDYRPLVSDRRSVQHRQPVSSPLFASIV